MAASKLAILSIFLALIFSQIRADASVPVEEDEPVKFPRGDGHESSLLKKGSLDAEQQGGKAHARAGEPEKKVNELKKELQSQRKEKEGLEARTNEAEKKIDVLFLKIENVSYFFSFGRKVIL